MLTDNCKKSCLIICDHDSLDASTFTAKEQWDSIVYGYISSYPGDQGTNMKAGVNMDLPGYIKEGFKATCEELNLQSGGTNGRNVEFVANRKCLKYY